MNIAQAKTIPIPAYLETEGHQPKFQRKGGGEYWYSSPLRSDDNTPSFKVDTEKNLWFDYGLSDGGDIIKLVTLMRTAIISEALAILDMTGLYGANSTSLLKDRYVDKYAPKYKNVIAGEKEKDNALVIERLVDISAYSLKTYLQRRGITLELAKKYLRQVHFKSINIDSDYYGLGFKSGEGYEIRNALFKGFAGTEKKPTLLSSRQNKPFLIFEGIYDYLALLEEQQESEFDGSVLILNSTALKSQALKIVDDLQCSEIRLFLDNDSAGVAVKEFFNLSLPGKKILDMSHLYRYYKDFNEMWINKSL